MDYQEFYDQLKTGKFQKLYLFEGEEEYGKESALQALRRGLLKGPMALMNESVLTNPPDSELIAVCETLPIMEERRLVIVRDSQHLLGKAKAGADSQSAEEPEDEAPVRRGDQLTPYMDRLPDSVCLVFFVRGKANGARRLYKKIREKGGIVSFDQLDQERLIKWIAREFKAEGLRIERRTAEQLVFACGRELMSLKQEVAKLAAYAQGRQTVTAQDIDAIATKNIEYRVFDLSDKVAAGQAGQALPLMHEMLKGGEQRLMLLALLQRHYRQLLLTRLMTQQRLPQADIASGLGVPPFVVRRLAQSAQAYQVQELQKAYQLCIRQEYLVKSGQLAEEGSLEQLILALLNIRMEKEARRHA